jgi:ATP-binding cassette subfamily F protein uup
MSLVAAHGISKAYGPSTILNGVDVSITDGERVGLVGSNGSGKSTLARILAGLEDADAGSVIRRRGAHVAFLAQEPVLTAERTGRQLVLEGLEGWSRARERYEAACRALEAGSGELEALLEEQTEAAATVERLGGWDLSHRAEAVMTELGVLHPDREVGTLSGGERRRVALARLLVARPDFAVLDEPTNHLDAETIEWLEEHLLNEYPGALLLITHDRWVLDRVVQRTLELHQGNLSSYDGGWEEYLLAKAEREELAQRTESNRRNMLRTELEWLSRQPKARTGKQKARIDRVQAAASAPKLQGSRSLRLELQAADLGATVLELHDLSVRIAERQLIRDLTLHVTKGERIGIIGRNGTGKTTLLRSLLGELEPEAGRVVRGTRVQFAYFDQGRTSLDDGASIVENVAGKADTVRLGDSNVTVYSYLDRFLFHGDRIRQPVGSLSGGERARVALAKMLLEPANVILMDEPTNDLDVTTLAALEGLLEELGATALVVTHDRYFLDRVATSILAFEGDGRVVKYPGGYSTFRSLRDERLRLEREASQAETESVRRSEAPVSRAAERSAAAKKKGLTFNEQKELAKVERGIAELETEVAALQTELAAPETYAERSAEVPALLARLKTAEDALVALMDRWEALETKRTS